MRPWVVALVVLGGACQRHDPGAIRRDPTRLLDAPAPAPEVDPEVILLHGKAIDLRARALRHELTRRLPLHEETWGKDGYLVGADSVLRAFSLDSGEQRWATEADCGQLKAVRGGVFCIGATSIKHHAREDGALHEEPRPAGTYGVEVLEDRLIVLREDRWVDVLDGTTGRPVGSLMLPFRGGIYWANHKASAHGTICLAHASDQDPELACVDATPGLRWRKVYRRSTAGQGALYQTQVGPHFALFSAKSRPDTPQESVVVDLRDGAEVARLDQEVESVVTNRDGSLEGLLLTRPTTRLLAPTGTLRWESTERLGRSITTLVVNNSLVVASFEPLDTGAELLGFDLASGVVRFRGGVELAPISHSTYHNETSVSLAAGALALRGRETGQDYLQLFDANTGAHLFSEVVRLRGY